MSRFRRRLGPRPAASRADTALTALSAEERRVMLCAMRHRFESEEQIARRLGLEPAAFANLVQQAASKLDEHYAGTDSAQARREGRLQ